MRQLLLEGTALAECGADGCDGQMVVRTAANEHQFLGCSNYPECQQTVPIPAECLLATELILYRVGKDNGFVHIVMVEQDTRLKFRVKMSKRATKKFIRELVEAL